MSNSIDVTVHFCCPHCSAAYQAAQERTAEECSGEFYCGRCGTPVHEWTGCYDFKQWKAVIETARDKRRSPFKKTAVPIQSDYRA